MKYYRLWVLAFFLKFLGSAWDASYHFKYLFEEYSIPHIVNFSGFALGAYLLYREWRNAHYMDRFSRNMVTIGYALFLIGIPLDFTYHIAYGIDLTTWSPTHFIYYIATDTMIFGVWRGYFKFTHDINPTWKSLHTWFAMFLLECLVFPNMQQENGAISYDQYIHGRSIASQQILELISNPKSQIFGGIPEWIYPNFSVLMVGLLTVLTIRFCRDFGIPVMAAGLYVLIRFIFKTAFWAVHYPTSYVPITILFIPLVYLWFKKVTWVSGTIGGLLYFLVLYVIHTSGLLITPPVVWWEFITAGVMGAIVPMIAQLVRYLPVGKREKMI